MKGKTKSMLIRKPPFTCSARRQSVELLGVVVVSEKTTIAAVMRGLDPRIHQSSQKHLKRWIATSSSAMTRDTSGDRLTAPVDASRRKL
jgi:hypothetical protein